MVRKSALLVALAFCVLGAPSVRAEEAKTAVLQTAAISLPAPEFKSKTTVEDALAKRRSMRAYSAEPLTLQQVSNLLWAAQGITDEKTGHRTAPSAMAVYPIKVYLVAGNVKGLDAGAYRYIPQGHKLELVTSGDQRKNVGSQPQMVNAPVLFAYVIDNVVAQKLGAKALEFSAMEIGHSAQNVLLEEVALGLGGTGMAGFNEATLKSALKLTDQEDPAYVVSAGKKP